MKDVQNSAEKDLLRLIENPGEAEKKKSEMSASKTSGPEKVKRFSLFSLAKKVSRPEAKNHFDLKAYLADRKHITRILVFVTVCVFIYFVMTVFHEYSKLKNTKNLVKFTYISEGKEARDTDALNGTKAQETAENDASSIRNIFKPDSQKKEEEKKDDNAVSLNDYRLVGISQAQDPKDVYAMIKNVKTNLTFFLKKEEKIDGMELVNILENKVVLKTKGREIELR